MIERITSPVYTNTSLSFKRNNKNNSSSVQHIDERKIINSVACLAIAAIAGIGYVNHKKLVELRDISKLNYIKQSMADNSVYSSLSRGKEAYKTYSKNIAAKKASVLQYKIRNGLFNSKSPQERKYIEENLANLKALASS